jgi:pimeloyl-ACP methyl ester carboxylesterase
LRGVTTYLLLPGAGGTGAYWDLVKPLLSNAIAVDLPGADETAGLMAYADIAVAAVDQRDDVILVAQSMGGFTAALVAQRIPLRALVFVNAMIPTPGETAGAWWDNTKSEEARVAAAKAHGYPVKFDLETYFLHDVPKDAAALVLKDNRPEGRIAFHEPCAFDRWPDIPIHVLAGTGDRFFPFEFQRRIARERLAKNAEPIPGGHLAALSYPRELAERLLAIGTS